MLIRAIKIALISVILFAGTAVAMGMVLNDHGSCLFTLMGLECPPVGAVISIADHHSSILSKFTFAFLITSLGVIFLYLCFAIFLRNHEPPGVFVAVENYKSNHDIFNELIIFLNWLTLFKKRDPEWSTSGV